MSAIPITIASTDFTATRALPPDHPRPTASLAQTAIACGRRFHYAMRRMWWSTYWKLTVEGIDRVPRRSPVLLCANHTSHLDALAILAALPRDVALRASTAAAKDVFADFPARRVVSEVLTNALPIGRGAEFARGLRELEAVLYARRPLILFPEGRRSTDGQLVEFKPGAAMLSLRTGTPIVPIHIDGARHSLPRGGYFPRPGPVRVRFGQPIDPRPYRQLIANGASKRDAYDRLTADLEAAIVALSKN